MQLAASRTTFAAIMLYPLRQFVRFYFDTVTKYQLHSPFVFDLTMAMLEDERSFYAFDDVELLRQAALGSEIVLQFADYGSGGDPAQPAPPPRPVALSQITRRASSSKGQGQALFRLANWAQPKTVLELGTSVGISTLYMALAAPQAQVLSLEGSEDCAAVARTHFEMLRTWRAEVLTGPFEQTLAPALARLRSLDLVFFDGNHRHEPTVRYFEQCLPYTHANTVLVFDDMHSSPDMSAAWQHVCQHPQVTLTVDFFDLSLAFLNPDFREKQHWRVIRTRFKPWRFW